MKIFADSGAFIALFAQNDPYHEMAEHFYTSLSQDSQFITTNLVLAETYTFLRYHGNPEAAFLFMQAALENEERGLWEIVRTTRTLEERALALARQFSDAALSWTDVVSFTICQERRLNTVFGFDHHFYLAGFRLVPETEKNRPGAPQRPGRRRL